MSRRLVATTLLFVFAACSDDRGGGGGGGGNNPPPPPRMIDAATAIATANANLRGILAGSAHAGLFADDSSVLKDIAGGSTSCTSEPGGGTTSCGPTLSFENDANDFADEIAARALNIANVESMTTTSVVLLLDPARACTYVASSGDPAPPPGGGGAPQPPPMMPMPDAECVAAFTATPMRLELTSRVDGDIDVTLLAGVSKARVITIGLHARELSIELDLAAAKVAAEAIITAFGGDTENIPETLTGRMKLTVTKNGENDYSATFGVLSTVHVASTNAMDPYDVEIAAAPTAITARVDGNAQTLSGAVAFASFRADLPLHLFFSSIDQTPLTGTMRIALAGLTGSSMVRASDDSVVLDDVGIGSDAFRMTVDGQPLVSVDLNASAGRKVDLTLAQAANGLSVKATPKLEVGAAFHFQTVASRAADIASWMLDDDLHAALEGGSPAEMIVQNLDDTATSPSDPPAPPPPAMPKALVRVAMGSLSISSRAAGRNVNVTSGQCLLQMDVMSATHPIEELASGTCPSGQ